MRINAVELMDLSPQFAAVLAPALSRFSSNSPLRLLDSIDL